MYCSRQKIETCNSIKGLVLTRRSDSGEHKWWNRSCMSCEVLKKSYIALGEEEYKTVTKITSLYVQDILETFLKSELQTKGDKFNSKQLRLFVLYSSHFLKTPQLKISKTKMFLLTPMTLTHNLYFFHFWVKYSLNSIHLYRGDWVLRHSQGIVGLHFTLSESKPQF